MPYNGSGSFSPPGASFPAVAQTLITSAAFNAIINDIATGLSTCLTKDGQQTATANIGLNGFKLTGVGAGTARTDGASLATFQDGTGVYVATVGGTGDAITLAPSPAIAAYTAGQTFRFIVALVNTTAVTVAVSGLTAKAITKNGTTALAAGDLPAGAMIQLTYDGVRFVLTASNQPFLPLIGGTLAGNLLFTDATYDIGATGATRPRDLFLSRNVVVGGTSTVTGNSTFGGTLGVTGVVTAPTAAVDTNTTQAATTAFVLAQSGSAADVETMTSTTKFVSPARQHFHPTAAKAWISYTFSAGVPTWVQGYNFSTTITDNGTGDATLTFTTAMSSATYAALVTCEAPGSVASGSVNNRSSTQIRVLSTVSGVLADTPTMVVIFGDQ